MSETTGLEKKKIYQPGRLKHRQRPQYNRRHTVKLNPICTRIYETQTKDFSESQIMSANNHYSNMLNHNVLVTT